VAHRGVEEARVVRALYVAVETLAPPKSASACWRPRSWAGLAQSGLSCMQRYARSASTRSPGARPAFSATTCRPPRDDGAAAPGRRDVSRPATREARASGRSRAAPGVLLVVFAVAFAATHGHGVDRDARVRAGARGLAASWPSREAPSHARRAAAVPYVVLPVAVWALVVLADRSAWIGTACGLGRARSARAVARAALDLAGARRLCRASCCPSPGAMPLATHARRREQPATATTCGRRASTW
jgi:hypothetical protein